MSKRLALLIANSDYADPQLKRLRTPTADAERLAEVLADPAIGNFEVFPVINQPLQEVREAIERLYQKKTRDDLLLLYYSGHGMRRENGELFFAVQNTKCEVLVATALDSGFICKLMNHSNSQRKVVLLDCCHSGAFGEGAKSLGSNAGTIEVFARSGFGHVILTASDALEYAWEGDKLVGETELSIFTQWLVKGLETGAADFNRDGDVDLDELYHYVFDKVVDEAKGRQTPQKSVHLEGHQIIIAHNPQLSSREATLSHDVLEDLESSIWWRRFGVVGELERFARSQDIGLANAAQKALEDLRVDSSIKVATAAARVLAYQAPEVEGAISRLHPGSANGVILTLPRSRTIPHVLRIATPIEMGFMLISGGEFLMGSNPSRDNQVGKHEQPPHLVSVSEFLISTYPVTHAQYVAFVRSTGYKTRGSWTLIRQGKDNHPVTDVTWEDAVTFCDWLSKESRLAVRLPTEAEWEKAARGTDGRVYPWGDTWDAKKANVKGAGPNGTTPVGQYSPGGDSPYGVADMAGNVWEWCTDWWDENLYRNRAKHVIKDPSGPEIGQYRVLRGGSWNNEANQARCACRVRISQNDSADYRGFRVVCAPSSSGL